MKNLIMIFLLVFVSIILLSDTTNSLPLKYISGCEIDLDINGDSDLVILIESQYGCELIALMRMNDSYNSQILFKGSGIFNLSCHYGYTIRETTAGKLKGRIFKTNGTYVLLTQPESFSIAFFWKDNKFHKVCVAD